MELKNSWGGDFFESSSSERFFELVIGEFQELVICHRRHWDFLGLVIGELSNLVAGCEESFSESRGKHNEL